MKYIKGYNRNQIAIFPVSLDASIDQENEDRIIDLFVDSLEIEKMGFKIVYIENGRHAYQNKPIEARQIFGTHH